MRTNPVQEEIERRPFHSFCGKDREAVAHMPAARHCNGIKRTSLVVTAQVKPPDASCDGSADAPVRVSRKPPLRTGASALLSPPGQLRRIAAPEAAAFTLLELLAVIGVVLCLAALLAPALASTSHGSKAFQCMNNMRRLMRATLIYAQDNSDFFPPNPDDGNTVPGHDWCAGGAGIGMAHEFDSDILADPHRSLLAPYLGGDVQVFHCPADNRVGRYDGADLAKQGLIVPAARTISISGAVGTVCRTFAFSGGGHSGPPIYPVNGPWLDGMHANMHNHPWRTYGKTSAVLDPGPASLFVLLEEYVLGLNDSCFAFSMASPKWVDFPGIVHDFGCNFAFADGHAELHKWRDPRTRIRALVGQVPVPGSPDWLWLSQRTSARAQ